MSILGNYFNIISILVLYFYLICFSDILDDIVEEAKANGTYEEGVLDVGNTKDKIEIKSKEKFSTSEDITLQLLKIHDYRGVEWSEGVLATLILIINY